jgi:hypothetical protein
MKKPPKKSPSKPEIPESLRPRELTTDDLRTMTKEELLLEQAKISLAKWGTLTPPDSVTIPQLTKRCPHCGETKVVGTDFGVRIQTVNGKTKSQSWCNKCRSSNDSHPTRIKSRRA